MEALDCPPEAVRRSRSRSPDATSHEPPTTPAVVVAGCDETAITPTIDPHLDASCSACMAASRWIPHTCKKARGVNKRHSTPAADGRRTKRSSVTAALGFRAPHYSETSVDVDSLSMTRSSMHDSIVRIVEGRDVPSHPSSSEAPPAPTRPPSPVLTPTLERGEASEVDGDVEMLPGTALLLPAQNTYTLHDPIRDAEHVRAGGVGSCAVVTCHVRKTSLRKTSLHNSLIMPADLLSPASVV